MSPRSRRAVVRCMTRLMKPSTRRPRIVGVFTMSVINDPSPDGSTRIVVRMR